MPSLKHWGQGFSSARETIPEPPDRVAARTFQTMLVNHGGVHREAYATYCGLRRVVTSARQAELY